MPLFYRMHLTFQRLAARKWQSWHANQVCKMERLGRYMAFLSQLMLLAPWLSIITSGVKKNLSSSDPSV